MSTTARVLLTALAALIALGGVSRTIARSNDAELKRAKNIARTTRFGSRNDTRIDVWFREMHPGHRLSWQPGNRGLFETDVPLILQVDGPKLHGNYPFRVVLDSRLLNPDSALSHTLVSSVRAWAKAR